MGDLNIFTQAAQLGGTVFTVVAFLWFLSKLNANQVTRDKDAVIATNRQSDSNIDLARALERLSMIITSNTAVNLKNTEVIKENLSAVKDNTEVVTGAIKENTETIKQTANTTNGNGNEK